MPYGAQPTKKGYIRSAGPADWAQN